MNKKIFKSTVASTLVLGMLAMPHITKASNDNYAYEFNIQAHYGNTYSPEARYRQTTDTTNKWKVSLENSTEGTGTKMTFWLAKDNAKKTVVSGTHDVTQGTGAHYYNAKSEASKTDVKLGAENNNDTTNSYTISGYWDEETN